MQYINTLLVAIITIYIVDLSGFTESWRSWLAQRLHVKSLKPLPPFDCGLCMTWWVCIIYALFTHTLTIYILAYIAFLSYFSIPIGQFLIFLKEGMIAIINRLFELCCRKG